jgi:hypothetical protein
MFVHNLTFRTHRAGRSENRSIPLRALVIAGWTGRDPVAREKHIAELEALGVPRPATTPIYYHVSASRLTSAQEIEVVGNDSSGEVEFVLIRDAAGLWLGVGSDHTDRKVETYNITVSKQVCEKPIAPELWAFDEMQDHWDSLLLRSWVLQDNDLRLYQEGSVASMLPPEAIIAGFAADGALPEGTAMFCGTLPAIGGVRSSSQFSFELADPVTGKRIAHAYTTSTLPLVG